MDRTAAGSNLDFGGGGGVPWCLGFYFILATSRCHRLELGILIDSSIVVEVGRCRKSLRCRCRGTRRFWRGRRCLVRGRCSLSLDSVDEGTSGRGEEHEWWNEGVTLYIMFATRHSTSSLFSPADPSISTSIPSPLPPDSPNRIAAAKSLI